MPGTGLVVLMWFAGQMLDGHVHKVQNGGKLVHCGGRVVEIVVHRRGEVIADIPVVDVEGWLYTEKDAWVPPEGKSLRLRETSRRIEVTLEPTRDHFAGKLPVLGEAGDIPIELEVFDGNRTTRARLTWTNLDERERLDDRAAPAKGAPRPPRRAPPEKKPAP
jgi:hypothetical protein